MRQHTAGGSTWQKGACQRGWRRADDPLRVTVSALTLSGVLPLLSLGDGQAPEALLLGLRQTALQTRRGLQQLCGVGGECGRKGGGSLGSRLGSTLLLLLHVLLHPRLEAACNSRLAAAADALAGGACPRSCNNLGSGCGGGRAHFVVHTAGALSACGDAGGG